MDESNQSYEPKRKLTGYEAVRNAILQGIQEKELVIGRQVYYQDYSKKAGNKANYQRALYFLEGAGIIVNEVIISDKVPKELMQRIGLVNE
ncbi:hypothetical protein E4T02_14445 [Listeria monocytogenes]|nr:hypothetical protein [Listeria monocytogenes]EAE3749698.1 hypothetical protein [Listeria monocytogenes]EAE5773689.1 hypothetical protein [Listeria monocytogenes]EAE6178232.1 hypothetical protein [Listeria monocytogenes]EAE6181293.1 hypothetical protein [Listeria monocytogenes]